MTRKILLFALLLWSTAAMAQTGQTRGQHWCGTETNAQIMQDYAAFLSVQQRPGSTQLDTFMNFPIQLHVITDLNQTIRISQGTLISTICELNDRYAPVRFRFFLRGDINIFPTTLGQLSQVKQ